MRYTVRKHKRHQGRLGAESIRFHMVSAYKDQRGFGALGVILVIVVLGVLGYTGWFVYHSSNETDKTLSASDSTNSTATAPVKTPTTEKTTFSKLPKDLQAAIVATTKEKAPSCVKDGKLVDMDGKPTDQSVNYLSSGFAETAIGCDGAAATVLAKTNGNWKVVGSTQMEFSCDSLKKYAVPVSFVKAISPDGKATCSTGTASVEYKV